MKAKLFVAAGIGLLAASLAYAGTGLSRDQVAVPDSGDGSQNQQNAVHACQRAWSLENAKFLYSQKRQYSYGGHSGEVKVLYYQCS